MFLDLPRCVRACGARPRAGLLRAPACGRRRCRLPPLPRHVPSVAGRSGAGGAAVRRGSARDAQAVRCMGRDGILTAQTPPCRCRNHRGSYRQASRRRPRGKSLLCRPPKWSENGGRPLRSSASLNRPRFRRGERPTPPSGGEKLAEIPSRPCPLQTSPRPKRRPRLRNRRFGTAASRLAGRGRENNGGGSVFRPRNGARKDAPFRVGSFPSREKSCYGRY